MSTPPVGLATKTGLAASLAQFLTSIALILNGDQSTEAVTTMIGAIITLITVLQGRYAQATAHAKKAAR